MKKNAAIAVFTLFIVTGLVLSSFTSHAIADETGISKGEYDLYAHVESFTWKEFSGGDQLLKESGPTYGAGASAKWNIINQLTLKLKGELFTGSIDYEGQAQSGTPVETDTDYNGFILQGDMGWKFVLGENFSIEPFAGYAVRSWERDIQSTGSAIGYIEEWTAYYARLGVRGELKYNDQLGVFTEAGIKIPTDTENEVDYLNVTLEPGDKNSLFAEMGFKWKSLKAAAFYEGMRFSESDIVRGYLQPESKANIYGLTVGWTF